MSVCFETKRCIKALYKYSSFLFFLSKAKAENEKVNILVNATVNPVFH